MELDLFETRTMLEALEQLKPARTFLLDTFFPTVKMHDTKHIDIDIYKGRRRTGIYVHPRMKARTVDRVGYSTRTYTPPYIKLDMTTDAMEAYNRMMGKNIYGGGNTPEDVARATLAKDMVELDNMITRMEEIQARDMLFGGTITISGDGISDTIDVGMATANKITLSGNARWSVSGQNVDPIKDMRGWKIIAQKGSGKTPTDVVMSEETYGDFLDRLTESNTSARAKFDLRRVIVGQIDPRDLEDGITFVGTITELGLDLWVYNEWYEDSSNVEQPMMTAESLFMLSRNLYTRRHYGLIVDLDAAPNNFMVKRFPKSYRTRNPSAQWLEMQSAPLIVNHQPDGVVRVLTHS
jgi:hypothetical protein